MKEVQILGLTSIPEIRPGDKLTQIIVDCAQSEAGGIAEKDIIVITEKVVSKAEGNIVALDEVKPGEKALAISKKTGESASIVQLILDNNDQEIVAVIPVTSLVSKYMLRYVRQQEQALHLLEKEPSIVITMDSKGRIYNEAGIDNSNHPGDLASFPPADPDKAAQELRHEIKNLVGKEVAVLIADTVPIPFGSIDLAMGSSGISTVSKGFGKKDRFGKPKFGGVDVIAHELTAAASLLFGQSDEGIPVVIVRGLDYQISEEENVQNTLVFEPHELRKVVGTAITATASIGGLKKRMLSRVLRWLFRI